ncbi:MAG: DNA repair protein RadA [Lachnospiraceae bacterium]|nr:DNA repair protein RadA [Lachnospiraceae bacterium]
MAKGTAFFCQSCGYESSKWMGQCPGCKEWNTFVEEAVVTKAAKGSRVKRSVSPVQESSVARLSTIITADRDRIRTQMEELDRVLGGGIVGGSLVLVGGDPGIGKSTLLLQMCRNLSSMGQKVLYISGEESMQQIKLRADRLGKFKEDILLLCETSLEIIEGVIQKERPDIVVIDSIQTMYREEISSAPGSVSQVRESTAAFMQLAKGLSIAVFLVGHVTKEGVVAGPRILEHMVDTVLYFEGDRYAAYRVLRAVKNRFGSTNEIGVFEMHEQGLVQVSNPSEYMLAGKPKGATGSVVACSMEGTRPVLLEIQALVCQSSFGIPRRTANGCDLNRINLLMAVLEKRLGMKLSGCDAYVNITGGLKMSEPAMDLSIIMALVSSFKNRPLDEDTIVFGEIGLSGEVRAVSMSSQRIAEAAKLGFQRCILPKVCLKNTKVPQEITCVGVDSVYDAVKLL